ncbi:hypothetical protein O3P69_015250 [Scylla paramamosain]|uniref:Uncharacterized protein n=1 Tax=Scylla paramamosain TaxID=85552 RepID=A0AAW0T4J8_SCYPA
MLVVLFLWRLAGVEAKRQTPPDHDQADTGPRRLVTPALCRGVRQRVWPGPQTKSNRSNRSPSHLAPGLVQFPRPSTHEPLHHAPQRLKADGATANTTPSPAGGSWVGGREGTVSLKFTARLDGLAPSVLLPCRRHAARMAKDTPYTHPRLRLGLKDNIPNYQLHALSSPGSPRLPRQSARGRKTKGCRTLPPPPPPPRTNKTHLLRHVKEEHLDFPRITLHELL